MFIDETFKLLYEKDISLVIRQQHVPINTVRQCVWQQRTKLQEEVPYKTGLLVQFEDEKAMYEVDIPTDTEEPVTDQYDSED